MKLKQKTPRHNSNGFRLNPHFLTDYPPIIALHLDFLTSLQQRVPGPYCMCNTEEGETARETGERDDLDEHA
jgi:hypothetical protein